MAKKKVEEKINLDSILFKCRDILRQARNSGSFFEKRDMMLTLVFLRFIGEKFEDGIQKLRQELIAQGLDPDDEVIFAAFFDDATFTDGTYNLPVEARWSKHDDFLTTFTFPGRFDIDITPENQPFFNWQTSNSPSSMTGETDGLAEVINFSCAFTDMISSQKVGGLYDALVMVFPETYDSRYNDLIERINVL